MSPLRGGGVGSGPQRGGNRLHRGSPAGRSPGPADGMRPVFDIAARQVLGRVLRAARERRGLSQEELAEAAGLDRTYPSLIERGLRAPRLSTFIRLCEAVGLSPARVLRVLTRPAKPRARGLQNAKPSASRTKRP